MGHDETGADENHLVRLVRNFNGYAPQFREASDAMEAKIAAQRSSTSK